jgi:hypothetical protein
MHLKAASTSGTKAMDKDSFRNFAAYNLLQITRQAGKKERQEESLKTQEWKIMVFH